MKPTKNLAYRVGGDYEDHKVIRVRQMNGLKGRLHDYKEHKYVRSDIVDHIIEGLAEMERDWNYETGFAGRYTNDMTNDQEIQIEKDQILKDYGIDK